MFRGFLQAKGTLYYQHTVLLYRRQRSPSLTYQLYHAVFSKENITILLSLWLAAPQFMQNLEECCIHSRLIGQMNNSLFICRNYFWVFTFNGHWGCFPWAEVWSTHQLLFRASTLGNCHSFLVEWTRLKNFEKYWTTTNTSSSWPLCSCRHLCRKWMGRKHHLKFKTQNKISLPHLSTINIFLKDVQ